MTPLPDAEALVTELLARLRAAVGPQTAMIGIHTGGAWLAERLHAALGLALPLGRMDISFYRDDYPRTGLKPGVKPSRIPFDVNDRDILLVDDVLYTGRTTRAALNELFDHGRPRSVHLAVLAERPGRELPIEARFAGATITVPPGSWLRLEKAAGGRLSWVLTARDAAARPA